jgi:hypothetical protein
LLYIFLLTDILQNMAFKLRFLTRPLDMETQFWLHKHDCTHTKFSKGEHPGYLINSEFPGFSA